MMRVNATGAGLGLAGVGFIGMGSPATTMFTLSLLDTAISAGEKEKVPPPSWVMVTVWIVLGMVPHLFYRLIGMVL